VQPVLIVRAIDKVCDKVESGVRTGCINAGAMVICDIIFVRYDIGLGRFLA